MMGDRKYIVVTTDGGEDTHILVFSWFLRHADIWKGARRSMRQLGMAAEVRSAGFIDHRGRPYGRSESLDLDGHEDDEEVLRDFLGGGYVLEDPVGQTQAWEVAQTHSLFDEFGTPTEDPRNGDKLNLPTRLGLCLNQMIK